MLDPWVRDYQTKEWKVYQVSLASEDKPALREFKDRFFSVCHSDSDLARSLQHSPARFYADEEMAAADIDPTYGCMGPFELAAEWRGHPFGVVVLQVCRGLDEDPPYWTYMVQIG